MENYRFTKFSEEEIAHKKATGGRYKYYSIDDRDLDYYDPSICDSFLHTEAANNVITLFKEAKALEKQFRVPLKDVLIRALYPVSFSTCLKTS